MAKYGLILAVDADIDRIFIFGFETFGLDKPTGTFPVCMII